MHNFILHTSGTTVANMFNVYVHKIKTEQISQIGISNVNLGGNNQKEGRNREQNMRLKADVNLNVTSI